MFKHLIRRLATPVLALGIVAGAAVAGSAPAHAATATATNSGPTPICTPKPTICVPQTWYVPTSVITNDGLLQLLPTSVEANTTDKSTQMAQTVTVQGTLTASVNGSIPVAPAPLAASVTPGGSASVSGSDAEQGTVQVPAHGVGYLKFGIIYMQVNGTAYLRNINGTVISAPEVATVPVGFGYVASDAGIEHNTVVVTKK